MSLEKVSLNASDLKNYLQSNLPREFSLTSYNSSFFAFADEGGVGVITKTGEYSFEFYELFELLADILVIGELKQSFYKDRHTNVNYKIPIVFWLLHMSGSSEVSIPPRKLKVALESDLQFSANEDIKASLKKRLWENYRVESKELSKPPARKESVAAIEQTKFIENRVEGKLKAETGEYSKVDILYATPRKEGSVKEVFSNKKSKEMKYGKAEMTIPLKHVRGSVERPSLFSRAIEIFGRKSEDGSKHIVVQDVSSFDKRQFLSEASSEKTALLFIHGFNVSFKQALYQSAQLKFDLAYDGNFILYSWPSKGAKGGYFKDKETAVRSGKSLSELLSDLSGSGIDNVLVLAHSMGTYCLSEAIKILELKKLQLNLRVALAAPDIDTENFADDYAKSYLTNTNGVSIYACNRDRALMISRVLHAADRLGYAKPLIPIPGMDTIDASSYTAGLKNTIALNHSYVFRHSNIIKDLFSYFFEGKAAGDRKLKAIPTKASPTHWEILLPI